MFIIKIKENNKMKDNVTEKKISLYFFTFSPPHLFLCRRKNTMKKTLNSLTGILIGIINILVGSCGGIVAVEALKQNKIDQTKSHATAIAVILPLTIISAISYLYRGSVKLQDSYIFLIPGMLGSAIGGYLLPKIPKKILNKIFSVFIIYAGVRMFLK